MVVKDTCEDRVEDKHDDTAEQSDREHSNGTEDLNGTVTDRLQTNSQNGDECSDEETETVDLSRLKDLIPSITAKDNITQLDIILEAIRYIDSLQNKLADKIDTGEIVPIQVVVKRKEEDL
eukprot:GFUD01077895.1.p1 GENE.GFUD01077895.1~~GFUD01077895.1.p1  ORF type:complete len:121 (+),score=56.17 GFUD01077895.1:42-404(+)